jgi:FkbM family methyltransferase
VGANVGQSALAYAEDWPSARILSFEPASALFSALVAHTSHLSQVEPHQLAFGVQAGEVTFVVDRVLSHIQRAGEDISEKATETVKVDTLTGFCDANGIQKIDFLKIDTEGFDLDVLKGAAALLDHDRIGIVQVEAGLSPLNTTHVPLEQLKTYLETKGYYLFGIYEQVHEWSGEPVARRCNPAFVSSALWKTLKWR